MRLDQWLVEQGLVPSRAKAQELIKSGNVEVLRDDVWITVDRPSWPTHGHVVRVKDESLLKYVSRGGLKLESALKRLNVDVTGLVALDIGISTGGFTDCLLQRGARRVVGIDVGSDQLSARLRGRENLEVFENVNIREAFQRPEIQRAIAGAEFCVVDVSFISLELVLPLLPSALGGHRLLALIKPQFELSAAALNKAGLVKAPQDLIRAQNRVAKAVTASGYGSLEIFPCEVKGGDGNQEFFLWASCPAPKLVR